MEEREEEEREERERKKEGKKNPRRFLHCQQSCRSEAPAAVTTPATRERE